MVHPHERVCLTRSVCFALFSCGGRKLFSRHLELRVLHPERTSQHLEVRFCEQLLLKRGATTPSSRNTVKTKHGRITHLMQQERLVVVARVMVEGEKKRVTRKKSKRLRE